MTKTYKSEILGSVHEAIQDAHEAGIVDKTTMREFDAACLTEVTELTPVEIVALREREGVSQAVLALHLNVAVKLVGEWERGQKRPSGPSLKLLSLIRTKGLQAVV